jgi:hypothetical protein
MDPAPVLISDEYRGMQQQLYTNPDYGVASAPCEVVAGIDVPEHTEPPLLDNVLDDLRRVVVERKAG